MRLLVKCSYENTTSGLSLTSTRELDGFMAEKGYERLPGSALYRIARPDDELYEITVTPELARDIHMHLWNVPEDYDRARICEFSPGAESRYSFQNYADGLTAGRCNFMNRGGAKPDTDGKTVFYLIRHGDPDYEHDSLTDAGREQAELLAERLMEENIDYVCSSPLGRALATAEPFAKLSGKDVKVLDWAAEIGLFAAHSPQSQLLSAECMAAGNRWYELPQYKDIPMEDVIARINGGLDRLFAAHRPEDGSCKIALFCHGFIGGTMLYYFFGLPINVLWAGTALWTTSVTEFVFEKRESSFIPRCLRLNDREHLLGRKDLMEKK